MYDQIRNREQAKGGYSLKLGARPNLSHQKDRVLNLQVAAVVSGAQRETWEEGDDKGRHGSLGGPKRASAAAVKQEAQRHADGHVVAKEDGTRRVLGALGETPPQTCHTASVGGAPMTRHLELVFVPIGWTDFRRHTERSRQSLCPVIKALRSRRSQILALTKQASPPLSSLQAIKSPVPAMTNDNATAITFMQFSIVCLSRRPHTAAAPANHKSTC